MQHLPFSSTAATLSDRISAAVPDRKRAAEIQLSLRSYRPVWDLAHQPAVLGVLLEAANQNEPLWWRPARVALSAIGVWQGLDDHAAAEAWLLNAGRPLLLRAAGKDSSISLGEGMDTVLVHTLVRDTCCALYHLHGLVVEADGQPGEASGSASARFSAPALAGPEGVLVCLYDLASCTSAQPTDTKWMVAVGRDRPMTAARVLLLNHTGDDAAQVISAARPIMDGLGMAQALAFIQALGDAGATVCAAELSLQLFHALPEPSDSQGPEHLAASAVRHLHRGLAAAAGESTTAIRELERAWGNGKAFISVLALQLGRIHNAQLDPAAAQDAYRLGLQLTPESTELRAAAAAALNAAAQYEDALDLLNAVSANQAEQDHQLLMQRARALVGLDERDAGIAAACQAAELSDAPEQNYQVARLLADVGEIERAIPLMEQAVAALPARVAWYGELGEMYVRQAHWTAAENCFRQLVALETDERRVSTLLRLGSVQRSRGDMTAALKTVTEAVHSEPQNPEILQEYVATAHAAQEWRTAIHAGHAALALQLDSVQTHVLMGEAFAALNQNDEALYHLRRATRLPAAPGSGLQPADAWLALAQCYTCACQSDDGGTESCQCQEHISQVEQITADAVQAVGEQKAGPVFFLLGKLYEKTGRLTEAHSMFRRMYEAGDRSGAMLTRFGRILNALGHHELAVAKLEEAVAQPDADGTAFHALALALDGAEQVAGAAAAARQAAALAPDDGPVLLDSGRLCLADHDAEAAVAMLQAAVAQLPKDAAAREWLGKALEAEGDWDAALDVYWTAARLNPTNPQLQHRIGVVSSRLGQHEIAITALSEAADTLPHDLSVQDALAEAFEAAGWWENAADIRERAASLSPDAPERLLAWASAARHAEDFVGADQAIARAQKVVPNSERLFLEQGLLRWARGDQSAAVRLLRDLVQDSRQPELLWEIGEILVGWGQVKSGADAFARAVDQNPDDPDIQVRLGDASASLGDPAKALTAYQAAARLQPANLEHQASIGRMYGELGRFAEAAQAWEQALRLAPEDVGIMEQLAHVYHRLGNPAGSLAMFERSAMQASQGGGDPGPMWREAGRVALVLAELEKAQDCLANALQCAPRDPEAHSLVGALASRLGRAEDAIDAFQRAAELAPDQRAYQLQLAAALTDDGRDADALLIWQELVRDTEDDDEAVTLLGQMGKLYARAGRFSDAERSLRAALERSPDDDLLQKQLAAVLVELGEEADFLRRSGVNVPVDHTGIEHAAAWLAGQDTLQEQRDLARAHLLVGRIDEAIAGLEAYSLASGETTSTDLNAQRALGVAYRLTGALDVSRDVLTTALRIALNDVRTAVELAQTYLAAGQPKTALTLLERLAEQFPENPTLLYHCAMASHAVEEIGCAIDLLRRAVECDSSVGKWQQTLATWLREQGEAVAALPYAEVAVELQPESLSAEARAELALVMADLQRVEEAIPLWHAALELEPHNSGWWGILGKLLLATGRPDAATDCYARAVELESAGSRARGVPAAGDSHEHHLGWARALLAMGELDEAGRHVESALDEHPNLAASHAGLGEWQAAMGNWQEALTSFRKAAALSGNGASAPPAERASYLLRVARAHRALGSPEKALQNLDRAAQMAPDLGAVFALMGDIHQELGNRDPARQAYQQATKVAPSDPGYALQLARFLQDEGQLDQALDWLMKTIAVAPTAALWIQAARVYQQRNQRGKRLEALHRAAALEPENARVYYELGLAYKQRKEYQMAIEAFEKAISLDPGDQAAHKQLSAVVAISITNEMGRG